VKGQSSKIQTHISQERPNRNTGKKSKFYTNSVKTKQPIQHNNFSIQPNKSRKSTLDASQPKDSLGEVAERRERRALDL
jgi:hypothetical protein